MRGRGRGGHAELKAPGRGAAAVLARRRSPHLGTPEAKRFGAVGDPSREPSVLSPPCLGAHGLERRSVLDNPTFKPRCRGRRCQAAYGDISYETMPVSGETAEKGWWAPTGYAAGSSSMVRRSGEA